MNRRLAERGFTLLELLVALVVLGFILAGIAQGVQFGQRVAGVQGRSIATHAEVAPAEAVLRRLIAGADPGTITEPPDMAGTSTALGFTTDLGDAAAALGVSGPASVELGVDGAHRLVLRWSARPALLRAGPAAGTAVLLDGVQGVEFAYWGHGEGGAGQWLTAWSERTLPPLIRVRLRFSAESRRSWPDIIAATERQHTGG